MDPTVSPRIEIPHFGIESAHEPEFVIDRPHGNEYYVFIHFQSPITLRGATGSGRFPRGAVVLYAPGAATWYSSIDCEMRHSWFHCTGPGVAECIARFALPVHQAIDLGPFGHIVPFLQEVRREQLRREPLWEEAVSARAVSFFLELGRAIRHQQDPHLTGYQREMMETLRRVRETVHSDPARSWSVEEMAAQAHLSASRFTALYSRFFEASPLDDLIETRLRQARQLLQQTAMPVERIAEACGFGSAAHFSRLFRQRVGCPPSRFRQSATVR